MKKLQYIAREIFQSKIVIHVLFILFVLLLFFMMAFVIGLPFQRFFRIFLFSIFILACIYAGRWNSRRWLLTGRLLKMALYSIASVIFLNIIGISGVKFLANKVTLIVILTTSGFVIFFFVLGNLLSIGRSTILRQVTEARISQQHRENELQLLRSQLSPHFLFNILNNLYGLSMAKDNKLPGLLLKLSDLLRYSIYETGKEYVPLTNELAYIDNYIELEKIRIGDKLTLVSEIQRTDIESINIAPMLLIVFVENAFKHSKNTLGPDIRIQTSLQVIEDTLIFSVKNSYSGETPENKSGEVPGIGLSVTLKRLELLYPGKYTLEKIKENGCYQLKLHLKIK